MRVLFVFDGSLIQERSGPAIRCLELARVIAQQHTVTLATSQGPPIALSGSSRFLSEKPKVNIE
jgi:hypothetical protein